VFRAAMACNPRAQVTRSGAGTLRTQPVATPRRRQTSAACNASCSVRCGPEASLGRAPRRKANADARQEETASGAMMSMLSGSARRDGSLARPTPPPEWSLVGMLAEEAGRIAQKNFDNALAPWMVRRL
jgi:hypothetical protein